MHHIALQFHTPVYLRIRSNIIFPGPSTTSFFEYWATRSASVTSGFTDFKSHAHAIVYAKYHQVTLQFVFQCVFQCVFDPLLCFCFLDYPLLDFFACRITLHCVWASPLFHDASLALRFGLCWFFNKSINAFHAFCLRVFTQPLRKKNFKLSSISRQ